MDNGHSGTPIYSRLQRGLPYKTLAQVLFLALTLAVSSVYSRAVNADELSLLVNGKAIHFKQGNKNYNEKNWGAGIQYDWAPVSQHWIPFAMASGFLDSMNNPSYYAGGGMMRRYQFDNLHFEAGAVAFVMTREGYKDHKPFLGALPAFSVGTKNVAMNITYIPKVDPKMVALVFFQLKINLRSFD
jgi:hypothetical protein